MTSYIHDDFLLTDDLAQRLYHEVAGHCAIYDYHNHLSPDMLLSNAPLGTLFDAWLKHDHYVWRAMRCNGIDEHFITGEANEFDKFKQWCRCMPYLIGNPLYHWCHLELTRFLGCDLTINERNAEAIWIQANERLASQALMPQRLIAGLNIQTLCTCDDPVSELSSHRAFNDASAMQSQTLQLLPTFRADPLFQFDDKWYGYVEQLETQTQIRVQSWQDYLTLIKQRMEYFHHCGCRMADLGISTVTFAADNRHQIDTIFAKWLRREPLDAQSQHILTTLLFIEFGRFCHQLDWVWQLHIGVITNINQRRFQQLGAGSGFSAISDAPMVDALAARLSQLDLTDQLPKLVIFNLNPNYNSVLLSLCGAFQAHNHSMSKIQFGPAWWFNDHKQGIEQQLTALKNLGAVGHFIGMTTDSRNVMSLSRHEYFRRILCQQLSRWAASGDVPNDWELLSFTVCNLCFDNANTFFNA